MKHATGLFLLLCCVAIKSTRGCKLTRYRTEQRRTTSRCGFLWLSTCSSYYYVRVSYTVCCKGHGGSNCAYYPPDTITLSSTKSTRPLNQQETFTCTTTGGNPPNPTLTIYRHKGGKQQLLNGNGPTIELRDRTMVKDDNGAKFYCESSLNGYPSVLKKSNEITYTVYYPHTVTLMTNASTTLVAGTTLTLTCSASGGNPENVHQYTWTRNGKTLQSTSRVYYHYDVKYNDGGIYACSATNDGGSASDSMNITVHYPPIWNPSLPKELTFTATLNQPAKLTLHVIANPAATGATWFWYHGTTNFSNLDSDFTPAKVNETTYTLAIKSVKQSYFGQYKVDVTSPTGLSAFIFKLVATSYSVSVSPPTVGIGESVTLSCRITNPTGSNVQWRRNISGTFRDVGTATTKQGCIFNPASFVTSNYRWAICSAPSTSSPRDYNIQIIKAGTSDTAAWDCIDIGAGSPSDRVQVKVQVPPVTPKVTGLDKPVGVGTRHTLTCDAHQEGISDPITYTWYKDNLVKATGSWLPFNPITKTDAGTYKCEAKNAVATRDSHNLYLEVYYPPDSITLSSMKSTRPLNQQETFTCTTSGGNPPNPTLTIYRDKGGEQRLLDGNGPTIELRDRPLVKDDNGAKFYCESSLNGYRSVLKKSNEITYTVYWNPPPIAPIAGGIIAAGSGLIIIIFVAVLLILKKRKDVTSNCKRTAAAVTVQDNPVFTDVYDEVTTQGNDEGLYADPVDDRDSQAAQPPKYVNLRREPSHNVDPQPVYVNVATTQPVYVNVAQTNTNPKSNSDQGNEYASLDRGSVNPPDASPYEDLRVDARS